METGSEGAGGVGGGSRITGIAGCSGEFPLRGGGGRVWRGELWIRITGMIAEGRSNVPKLRS